MIAALEKTAPSLSPVSRADYQNPFPLEADLVRGKLAILPNGLQQLAVGIDSICRPPQADDAYSCSGDRVLPASVVIQHAFPNDSKSVTFVTRF